MIKVCTYQGENKEMKKLFTEKNFTYFFIIVFIFTLIPICYLSFINRATGDDYGYAVLTREAWQQSHSVMKVIQAAIETVKQYYYGWQGTWFSIFLFTFQPEVFGDQTYVITAFLMLFLWIGSTFLMFHEIFVIKMNWDKWNYRLFTIIFLMISIQFIPSTKSAIFWFNGCAHYMIPFAMCQLLVYSLLRFRREYNYGWYAFICFFMTLLGGANYQAAIFGLIITLYLGIEDYLYKKKRKICLLILPTIMELTGLIISMLAPGNKSRGGENFGFSIPKVFYTIGFSFVEGMRDCFEYMKDKPIVFVGLIILFFISLNVFRQNNYQIVKHPILGIFALYCLYSAMQAPALYAGVDVSGGVYNMNYQVFLLTASGSLIILAQQIALKYARLIEHHYKRISIFCMLICFIVLLVGRSSIKTSTLWISIEYITSGQAADYKEQMDLQTKLMEEENVSDIVLPFINDEQGPLMHMPVTDNPNAWTNTVTKNFYGKNSVVAMPRPEWEQVYMDN